jgi:hypothetical protein
VSDIRARLADALRKHNPAICHGQHYLEASWSQMERIWAQHVADVLLSLPGIAIVELPDREIDPTLLWLLRRAGDEWGPLGVLRAAAAVQAQEEQS